MSELQQPNYPSGKTPDHPTNDATRALFAERPQESGGFPAKPLLVAGLAVLVIVAGLVFASRRQSSIPPNTMLPLAAYAPSLPLSQLAMSESESLSGGKSTFIDGHIRNTGGQVVTGVTVQVLFRNDEAMPPQIETVPLSLIRTREPYVDTQSVASTPLKPGDDREFRLIFESIPNNWNTQMPEIHVIRAETK
jgi:hypothetical protein